MGTIALISFSLLVLYFAIHKENVHEDKERKEKISALIRHFFFFVI